MYHPTQVGSFTFAYNVLCCYLPFTYIPVPGSSVPSSQRQRLSEALDLVCIHLDTARPIILANRNTWKNVYHVYDNAERALQREWVPKVNRVLLQYGYEVDARATIHGLRTDDRRQLISIRVFQILPPEHPSRAPENHIGELPMKRKTPEERIRDIQQAIQE